MNLSLMTESERIFIDGLVREYKPKKILEIGVAAGASSLVLLNASKEFDTKVYSIDYYPRYCHNAAQKTGFLVDYFPELKNNWNLYTGGMAAKFIDEIGDGIDFCLLDAAHFNPGEFLDYLQILPYLAPNALIVVHDVVHHTNFSTTFHYTCSVLFSVLNGKKFMPLKKEHPYCANIGAVQLYDDAKDCAYDIFNCLFLPWIGCIDNDLKYIKPHLIKHYDKFLINIFENAYTYNKNLSKTEWFNNPPFYKRKPISKKIKQSITQLLLDIRF